ncbi:MAG: OsmC family protein [Deltaproteobacteria bacterium]|nr:OsmC family protein [Deltaproteobacteria bacterium]
MNIVRASTVTPSTYPLRVEIRAHALGADMAESDTAPDPHDYFDTALATCKALTAQWYAKRHGIPLERVESEVERDDAKERAGVYHLRVKVTFHGPLTDEQRALLYRAIGACPVHKLMTTTEVEIETVAPEA